MYSVYTRRSCIRGVSNSLCTNICAVCSYCLCTLCTVTITPGACGTWRFRRRSSIRRVTVKEFMTSASILTVHLLPQGEFTVFVVLCSNLIFIHCISLQIFIKFPFDWRYPSGEFKTQTGSWNLLICCHHQFITG